MISGLPSKKIFFLVVACVIGISAVSFAAYSTKKQGTNDTSDSLFANSAQKNNAGSIDSVENSLKARSGVDDDSDGLLNWEESLWETDTNNPDSDADGTKDGEEVKANRNPNKAGPDDALQAGKVGTGSSSSTSGTSNTSTNITNTETAKISRDLFTSYIQAKQAGLTVDEATTQKIVGQAIAEKISGVAVKTYTLADIKTNTGGDFKTYGNKLGQTLTIGATQNRVSEIEIVQKALAAEDSTQITKLDPIIAGYTKILSELAQISVPKEAANQHLNLLNSVSRMLGDIQNLRAVFEDPILGLIGISSYYKNVESMRSALGALRALFVVRGISFTQSEYGYVFMQTI